MIPFCTTWVITTVQIHLLVLHTERNSRLWQPVSWIGHWNKSPPNPASNIRAIRRPEVLTVPYSQRMHTAYRGKNKKTSSLGKTASACTCISNHPWRIIHSRRRKIDTSQDFSVFFLKSRTKVPPFLRKRAASLPTAPLPNPSLLQLSHFFNSFIIFF